MVESFNFSFGFKDEWEVISQHDKHEDSVRGHQKPEIKPKGHSRSSRKSQGGAKQKENLTNKKDIAKAKSNQIDK